MSATDGKNRVMGDLMRSKGGWRGPSDTVTSKDEKEQGERNGEGLCVFTATCLA